MSRKVMALFAAFVVVLALMAGCGPAGSGQFKVAMVTDVGGLGDQSFNDSAHAGLKQAESELGAKIAVVESNKQEDYEANLKTALDQQMDLVWSIGYLMTDATKSMALKNPNGRFAIIDSVVADDSGKPLPNVASVTFKEQEGSFLVGYLAAKATKTNKVGFVGGIEGDLIKKFESGFRAGVKAANPGAAVIAVYTGAFDDPGKGKEAAIQIYGQGADIIYHASGACGIGVIEAAKEQNKLAIGVDSDQNSLAPNNVLSSMMKRVDVAVFTISKATKDGQFPGGTITVLGLKENAVGWSDTTKWELLPEGTKAEAEKWRQAIVDGKVTVPSTIDEFNSWQVPSI